MLLVEHHLDGVVILAPLGFLLRDSFDPGVREEVKKARLLIALVPVFHVPPVQDVLSPGNPAIPADESPFSKKKCFSNALGYTLVVLEVL